MINTLSQQPWLGLEETQALYLPDAQLYATSHLPCTANGTDTGTLASTGTLAGTGFRAVWKGGHNVLQEASVVTASKILTNYF